MEKYKPPVNYPSHHLEMDPELHSSKQNLIQMQSNLFFSVKLFYRLFLSLPNFCDRRVRKLDIPEKACDGGAGEDA